MVTSLLKKFLKGLFYIFTLPILLVVLSLYAVIGIIVFVFLGLKAIILFFTGRNLFGELPEDVKARQIITGEKQQYVLETTKVNIPVQGEELVIGTEEKSTLPESTLPPEEDLPSSTLPEETNSYPNYDDQDKGGEL